MAKEKETSAKLLHNGNNFLFLVILIMFVAGGIMYCINPESKDFTLPIVTALIGYLSAGKR
jgi:hypothetical protein